MKNLLFLCSILVILFSSCEKKDKMENQQEAEYFPNSIDSYWEYERFDSLTNTSGTLTVEIIGDTTISSDLYAIWKYTYVDKQKKLYVLQKEDSILILNDMTNRVNQTYIIPFEMNNSWVNPDYLLDTSRVINTVDIEINEINYTDVMVIERNAHCCNDFLKEKIWIKPGIGLIKLERNHLILGPYEHESWELIDHHIE